MSISAVVALLEQHRPRTAGQAEGLGIRMRLLRRGCFRETFLVKGLPVVLKFPFMRKDGYKGALMDVWHGRREIAAYQRIETDPLCKPLRRYMPRLYYSDYQTGVVAMHRYFVRQGVGLYDSYLVAAIKGLVNDCLASRSDDISGDNVLVDARGRIRIVDLGLTSSPREVHRHARNSPRHPAVRSLGGRTPARARGRRCNL